MPLPATGPSFNFTFRTISFYAKLVSRLFDEIYFKRTSPIRNKSESFEFMKVIII